MKDNFENFIGGFEIPRLPEVLQSAVDSHLHQEYESIDFAVGGITRMLSGEPKKHIESTPRVDLGTWSRNLSPSVDMQVDSKPVYATQDIDLHEADNPETIDNYLTDLKQTDPDDRIEALRQGVNSAYSKHDATPKYHAMSDEELTNAV